jgi:hypothetical protein
MRLRQRLSAVGIALVFAVLSNIPSMDEAFGMGQQSPRLPLPQDGEEFT